VSDSEIRRVGRAAFTRRYFQERTGDLVRALVDSLPPAFQPPGFGQAAHDAILAAYERGMEDGLRSGDDAMRLRAERLRSVVKVMEIEEFQGWPMPASVRHRIKACRNYGDTE
jgi:hypothetical protein